MKDHTGLDHLAEVAVARVREHGQCALTVKALLALSGRMAEVALSLGEMVDIRPDPKRAGLYLLSLGGTNAR